MAISQMYVLPNIPYSVGGGLPTPTKSGYTFFGWFDSQTHKKVTDSACSSYSNRDLYARWTKSKSGCGLIVDGCIIPERYTGVGIVD